MHASIEELRTWDWSLEKWRLEFTDLGTIRSDVSGCKYSKGRQIEEQRLRTEICPIPGARESELTNNEIEKGDTKVQKYESVPLGKSREDATKKKGIVSNG